MVAVFSFWYPNHQILQSISYHRKKKYCYWYLLPWRLLFAFCLLSFLSHSRDFHTYGDVSITDEGLQILTFARHSWPLNSEGSLACHTYCDTAHPFIMVISWTRDTQTRYRAFSSGSVTIWFYDLGLSRLAFEHHTFSLRGEHSNGLRHRCGPWRLIPLGEKHEKRKHEQRIYQLFLDFLTNDYWFKIYSALKQLFLYKWISFRNWIEKLYCNVCRIFVIIHIGLIEPQILE